MPRPVSTPGDISAPGAVWNSTSFTNFSSAFGRLVNDFFTIN